jgi:hypothetical protein
MTRKVVAPCAFRAPLNTITDILNLTGTLLAGTFKIVLLTKGRMNEWNTSLLMI